MFNAVRVVLLTTTVVVFVVTSPLSADVINIEFNPEGGGTSYSGNPGVAPDPLSTHYWNQVGLPSSFTSYTSGSLLTSDGTTDSQATVSLSRANPMLCVADSGTNYAPELLNDFVLWRHRDEMGDATLAIDGLVPGETYDLYFYGQQAGWQDYGVSVTIGGTTHSTDAFNPPGFVLNENYVVFEDVVATGGSISAIWTPEPGGWEGCLNGVQVVGPIVPEPSTLVFLATCLALVPFLRRRRG